MCGIAGIVRFDGTPVDVALLDAMAGRLVHRGPDGHGVWIEGPVGFAHRRLSIIDLAGSPQPMSSVDDRHHVTFNGEILNYKELRSRSKYPFRTNGDTEVLLALYAEQGAGFVERLRGQFAFAIHDASDGSVTLFRDRLGILPLYYAYDSSQLVFASELKAVLPALSTLPDVDESGLAAYLAHRSVPAPRTLVQGIRKLPPGHRLLVKPDGSVLIERWWSLPDVDTTQSATSLEATALVEEALRASVDENLVADVPVGAYLSGGVDSSLIVALMTERVDSELVHTFSAGFGDAETDETHHALRVSEHLGTVHHEVTVAPDDFERLWPMLTWHRDAPVSEPADVAVFRLAELAREQVKVVLSGEGSDELFAGYPKYRFARAAACAGKLPSAVRGPAAELVQRELPARFRRARIAVRAMGAEDEAARLEAWFAPFTPPERDELLGRPARRPGADIPLAEGDAVRRMLFADCHAWLADNLLERGDRMSMAASLELRPPFLDHRLVELAFSLPSDVKLRDGVTKWVVKEVARRRLPASIVDRPKAGFRVPLAAWFRASLRGMARDRLLDAGSFVSQVFDRRAVADLLASHDAGRRDEDIRIWTLLSLEIWHETFREALRDLGGPAPRSSMTSNP
jgi:asparagine synthase (glutamine-hydrolysing)